MLQHDRLPLLPVSGHGFPRKGVDQKAYVTQLFLTGREQPCWLLLQLLLLPVPSKAVLWLLVSVGRCREEHKAAALAPGRDVSPPAAVPLDHRFSLKPLDFGLTPLSS